MRGVSHIGKAGPNLSDEWLVIQLGEGADHGTVKLLPSADAAQEYLAATVASGVDQAHLLLFSHTSSVDFSVAYQPVVKIATPAQAAAAAGQDPAPARAPQVEAQGTQNGVRLSSMFNTD